MFSSTVAYCSLVYVWHERGVAVSMEFETSGVPIQNPLKPVLNTTLRTVHDAS